MNREISPFSFLQLIWVFLTKPFILYYCDYLHFGFYVFRNGKTEGYSSRLLLRNILFKKNKYNIEEPVLQNSKQWDGYSPNEVILALQNNSLQSFCKNTVLFMFLSDTIHLLTDNFLLNDGRGSWVEKIWLNY